MSDSIHAAADAVHAALRTLREEIQPNMLREPADVYAAVGELTMIANRLAILPRGLDLYLREQYEADAIESDNMTGIPVRRQMSVATLALKEAGRLAADLRDAYSEAHQATAHLQRKDAGQSTT